MYLALYRMMLDSWSVHLTLYRMTPCWTRDLCIWHTEWLHVGLVICVSDIIQNDDGLVICVSAIIQNDNMLDSWSMYLALYGMMLDLWSVYLTWYRMMMDSWSVYLTFYRMTPCWTRDLCIWHYTEWLHVGLVICIWHYIEWRHVGLVICVSDIIHDEAMLDSWYVYLT